MSAVVEYRIVVDVELVALCQQRHRESQPGYRRQRVLNAIAAVLLVAFGILIACIGDLRGQWSGVFMIVLGLSILWVGPALERYLLRRRIGASREAYIVLDEAGLHAESGESTQETGWSMLDKVRAFKDGFLLHDCARNLRWLPHSAIVSGTKAEAEALLRAKVKDFAYFGSLPA